MTETERRALSTFGFFRSSYTRARKRQPIPPLLFLLALYPPPRICDVESTLLLLFYQSAPACSERLRRMTLTTTSGSKAEKNAQGVDSPLVAVISALTVPEIYTCFVAGLSESRDMARKSYAERVISSNAPPCRLHQTALPRLPRAHRVRPSTARRYRTVLLPSSIAHQIRLSSSILALIQPHRLDIRFISTLGNYAQKIPLPKLRKKNAETTYDFTQHLIAEEYDD